MGLPILIPYCPKNNGARMLWIPVHVKDIERYGLDVVLKAVRSIGVHGLKLKSVGSPAAMNLLDGKLTTALSLSAVEDDDDDSSSDEDDSSNDDSHDDEEDS